jgi:hypothetical protein
MVEQALGASAKVGKTSATPTTKKIPLNASVEGDIGLIK